MGRFVRLNPMNYFWLCKNLHKWNSFSTCDGKMSFAQQQVRFLLPQKSDARRLVFLVKVRLRSRCGFASLVVLSISNGTEFVN